MPKSGANSTTPFLAGFVAAFTLATISSGAARANNACVPGKPGAVSQHCQDVSQDHDGLLSVMPAARQAPSAIALRARNATQRSTANAHTELLLALGSSRDDASTILSAAGDGDDGPQRIQPEATKRSMLMAALALAGIAGSVIFKLGSLRYTRRTRLRKRRGAIWAAAGRARRTSKLYAGIDDRPRQPDAVRDLDQVGQRKASQRKPIPRRARRSAI